LWQRRIQALKDGLAGCFLPEAAAFVLRETGEANLSLFENFKCLWQRLCACLSPGASAHQDQAGRLEVERKYRIRPEAVSSLGKELSGLGFKLTEVIDMCDLFLPVEGQGEMLRIREESSAGRISYLLTHKVWVQTSAGGRERREIEEPLGKLARDCLVDLSRSQAAGEPPSFSKRRAVYRGKLAGHKALIALDAVAGLGLYSGDYMEIEILVEKDSFVLAARQAILKLASRLLGDEAEPVSMSYREMLEAVSSRGGA